MTDDTTQRKNEPGSRRDGTLENRKMEEWEFYVRPRRPPVSVETRKRDGGRWEHILKISFLFYCTEKAQGGQQYLTESSTNAAESSR